MGGTGSLVNGLVALIESLGGTLRYNAPVRKILVERQRAIGVELQSGERLHADVVVSNADSAATYRYLVPASARKRWTDRKLARARYSMSLFVWYFGTGRQYPDIPHHMMLLSARYKGLLDDIFSHKRLAGDFSLYLHRPTATDPSLAPQGCDTFYVLSPVPHLDSGVDWTAEGERYRAAIGQYLAETVMPDLEQHVVTSRLLTPLDFEQRLWSLKGAAFGLEPVLTQTAWFRPHNRSEELDGLYLVGAGTHPGAGMPGVISSAKVLDEVVPDPATSGQG
jgi:phytoene desaturase